LDALAKHLGVRFLYAEGQSPAAATGEDELDVAQLKDLPPALIEALREAAVLLDDQHCLENSPNKFGSPQLVEGFRA
jgi:hypothetical protein